MMTTQQMWVVHLLDENLLRRNKSFQRRPDRSSSKSSSKTSKIYKKRAQKCNEDGCYLHQVMLLIQ